jgi:hypothetical protein
VLFPHGVVTAHHVRAVGGRCKPACMLDNVEAGLCRAHSVRVHPAPIGEGLSIVIVLLLEEAE